MAAPRIFRSPEAKRDLLEIWAYIARDNAPSIADAVLARIEGAMEIVAFAPYIGRERPEFIGRPRSIAVRPYVIFYQSLPEGDGIVIWRVMHGRRDFPRRLVRRRPRAQ